jgi:hypothetical protein
MQKQQKRECQSVDILNPKSQLGFENESSHIQSLVKNSKICAKKDDGIRKRAQIANKHDTHKKRIKSGVKIKFDKRLIDEIGRPQMMSAGSDINVMTSCSSIKLIK